MAKPVLQPEPWATTATYPNSVYPATYPWGDPHPSAGAATPWSLQPRRIAVGLAAFAAEGLVPLQASKGELFNEELARIVDLTRWVFDGSPLAGENAHIVETDSAGIAQLYRLVLPGAIAAAPGDAIQAVAPGGDGTGIVAIGAGSGRGGLFQTTGTGNALKAEANNGVPVVFAEGTGGNTVGVCGKGAGSGAGVEGIGAVGSVGVLGTADAGSSVPAIRGNGGNGGSGATGVEGNATNVGAVGVQGKTAPAPTEFAGRGVVGTGLGQGIGVWGSSVDSYAGYFFGDPTSPRRAAIRLVPQDADPSAVLEGDAQWNSSRGSTGKMRVGNAATVMESVHSTPKGYVFGCGSESSGGPIGGGSGDISSFSITAEEIGDVLLELTTSLEWSVTNGTCQILLRDVTAGVTIKAQTEAAPDRDGSAPERRSAVLRARYTLPAAGFRTFAAQVLAGTGNITWDGLIASGRGVL